jgi:VCBS repeat-containing protein
MTYSFSSLSMTLLVVLLSTVSTSVWANNQPPVVAAMPLQIANVGEAYSSYPIVTDADGDLLHWSVKTAEGYQLPSWLSFSNAPTYLLQTGVQHPFTNYSGSRPALGDVDGDGDLDVLVLGQGGNDKYFYRNIGTAFQPEFVRINDWRENPFDRMSYTQNGAPALIDLDADGDLDLVTGYRYGIRYYRNDGSATAPDYQYQTNSSDPFNAINIRGNNSLSFADLDGDDDLDAVLTSDQSTAKLLLNTGTKLAPNFVISDASTLGLNLEQVDHPGVFSDFDQDGDLDFIIERADNDGSGDAFHYYENTGTTLAPQFIASAYTSITDFTSPAGAAAAMGDLDADGDLDMLLGDSQNGVQSYYFDRPGLSRGTASLQDLGTHEICLVVTDGTANVDTCYSVVVNVAPTLSLNSTPLLAVEDVASQLDLSSWVISDSNQGDQVFTIEFNLYYGTFSSVASGDGIGQGVQLVLSNDDQTLTISGTIADLHLYLSDPTRIQYLGIENGFGIENDRLRYTLTDAIGSSIDGYLKIDVEAVDDPVEVNLDGAKFQKYLGRRLLSDVYFGAPYDLAMSADGKFLYSANENGYLYVLQPDPVDQSITPYQVYALQLADPGNAPILVTEPLPEVADPDNPIRSSFGPERLQISADQNWLFVMGWKGLLVFQRDLDTGALTQVAASHLNNPKDIVVSNDNRYVYAFADGQLDIISFDLISHQLENVASLDLGADISSMAISPDGASLYFTQGVDSLLFYQRDVETGLLSLQTRYQDTDPAINGLTDVLTVNEENCRTSFHTLNISPDGKSIYISGFGISEYSRDVNSGEITFSQRYSPEEKAYQGLYCSARIHGSANGEKIYILSDRGEQTTTIFDRDSVSGNLTLSQIIYNWQNGVERMNEPASIATSADNRHFYIGNTNDADLLEFKYAKSDFIYHEKNPPVRLNMGGMIIDVDDANSDTLQSLSLTISNPLNPGQEVLGLAVNVPEGLSAQYDQQAHRLTISGEAAFSVYRGLLSQVTYINQQRRPDTTTRIINVLPNDGQNNSFASQVQVEIIEEPNVAPEANAENYTLLEAGESTGNVLTNDLDANDDSLTAVLVSSTSHGSLTLATDGHFVYQHDGSETLVDSFSYQASDDLLESVVTQVSFTISPVNDAPSLADQTFSSYKNTPLIINHIDLIQDTDSSQFTTLSATSTKGSLTINDAGHLVYTPITDFLGDVLLDISIADDGGLSDSAQFTLSIIVDPTNVAPIGVSDELTVAEAASVSANVLSNDVDYNEDVLTARLSQQPSHGSITFASDGRFVYQHDGSETSSDRFSYFAFDGLLNSAETFVELTITAVNDAPSLADQRFNSFKNTQLVINHIDLIQDIDSSQFTTLSATTVKGSLNINAAGHLVYTPMREFVGDVLLNISIADDGGLSDSARFMVSITEDPNSSVNQAPVAIDDALTVSSYDSLLLDVVANDLDADQDPLTLVNVQAELGQASIVDNQLAFIPTQGAMGVSRVRYTISDGQGEFAHGYAMINIDAQAGSLLPTITAPADLCGDLEVSANALYTRVDLGVASAVDRFGNSLPVSLIDGTRLYPTGTSQAYWQATDSDGRTSIASQRICILPLVSFAKDQVVLAGEEVVINAYLNGISPEYPVTVSYTLAGTADSNLHTLEEGELVFTKGSHASLTLSSDLSIAQGGDTDLLIELQTPANLGAKSTHTITFSQGNLAPELSLNVEQAQQERLIVAQDAGQVSIYPLVSDDNADDVFSYQWQTSDNSLINNSDSDIEFHFDPALLELGVYNVTLTVADNGLPSKSVRDSVYIQVVESLTQLTDQDSDGDGISDIAEGYSDQDGDGIPDYLDRINECNVLLQKNSEQDKFLVEGNPGVCLRRGNYTLEAQSGGALISKDDFSQVDNLFPEDDDFHNIGGMFDFIAYGLPETSQSIAIVFPQRNPIPTDAVYRKYQQALGWHNFTVDDKNRLSSTQGEPGYCPPPNSSSWQVGLNEGHWCVQIEIEDGGVNDDDGLLNGTVVDPGFVGSLITANTLPVASDMTISLQLNGETLVDVLSVASDDDGDVLNISSADANLGQASIENGYIQYTALADYTGNDVVTFGINDGNGGTSNAQVNITIRDTQPASIKTESSGGSLSWLWLAALALVINMKRIAVLLGLSLAVFSVHANDLNTQLNLMCAMANTQSCSYISPWYIGGQLGSATTNVSQSSLDNAADESNLDAQSFDLQNQGTAYSLFAGYQFTSYFALEAGYLDLGERDVSFSGQTQDSDQFYNVAKDIVPQTAKGILLNGIFSYSLPQNWQLVGKLGAFSWSHEYTSYHNGEEVGTRSTSNVDLALGVEANYRWNKNWEFYAGYDYFNLDDQDANSMGLGFRYRFNGERTNTRRSPAAMPAQPLVAIVEPVILEPVIQEPVIKKAALVAVAIPEETTIQFYIDSYSLNEAASQAITTMVGNLTSEPNLVINLQGQASKIGDSQRSKELSNMRVHQVARQLFDSGIAANRVRTSFTGDLNQGASFDSQRVKITYAEQRPLAKELEPHQQLVIEFDIFSLQLSDTEEQALDKFVANNKYAREIIINVFEIPPGDEVGLKELAYQRAAILKEKLKGLGVTQAIVSNHLVLGLDSKQGRKAMIIAH